MKKQETLQALCELTAKVADHLGNHICHSDCFCGESPFRSVCPETHSAVIKFIRNAVEEKIREEHLAEVIYRDAHESLVKAGHEMLYDE